MRAARWWPGHARRRPEAGARAQQAIQVRARGEATLLAVHAGTKVVHWSPSRTAGIATNAVGLPGFLG
jgi:hypothetical protein